MSVECARDTTFGDDVEYLVTRRELIERLMRVTQTVRILEVERLRLRAYLGLGVDE